MIKKSVIFSLCAILFFVIVFNWIPIKSFAITWNEHWSGRDVFGTFGEDRTKEFPPSSLNFHNGVDICYPSTEPVKPVEAGYLKWIVKDNYLSNIFIVSNKDDKVGWSYAHVECSQDFFDNWEQNQNMFVGTNCDIGRTVPPPGSISESYQHIHWARFRFMWPNLYAPDIMVNPFTLYSTVPDNQNADIENILLYKNNPVEMLTSHSVGSHSGVVCLDGDVEIIVNAETEFNVAELREEAGIYSIGYKVEPVDTGYNISPGVPYRTMLAFNQSKKENFANGTPNSYLYLGLIYGPRYTYDEEGFYDDMYLVTNSLYPYSESDILDEAFANVAENAWQTNVRSGQKDDDSDLHDEIANTNAEAKYCDGYYNIKVCATGYPDFAEELCSCSTCDFEEKTVYVNNFNQMVEPCNQQGRFQLLFSPTEPVYVQGEQYLPRHEYEVLVVEDIKCWPRNSTVDLSLLSVIHSVTVSTDENGNIPPTDITPPLPYHEGTSYDIVIDYDGDGFWSPPVEGIAIDGLASNLIGTGGFCVATDPVRFLSDCLDPPDEVTARCSGSERESDMDKGYTLGGVVVSWEYQICPEPSLYDLGGISGFNIYRRKDNETYFGFKCAVPVEDIDYIEILPGNILHMEKFIHWTSPNMSDIFDKGEYAVKAYFEPQDLMLYIESELTDSQGLEVRASHVAPEIVDIKIERGLGGGITEDTAQYGVIISYPPYYLAGAIEGSFYITFCDESRQTEPENYCGDYPHHYCECYCFPMSDQYFYDEEEPYEYAGNIYSNVFVYWDNIPDGEDFWYFDGFGIYFEQQFNAAIATTYPKYQNECLNFSDCDIEEYSYNIYYPPFNPQLLQVEGVIEGYPTYYMRWYEPLATTNNKNLEDAETATPSQNYLHKNYPNPFNPTTTIEFDLAKKSNVKIDIYDAKGNFIKVLLDDERSEGYHVVQWDGTDENGNPLPSGMYLYKINTPGYKDTKQMLLVK